MQDEAIKAKLREIEADAFNRTTNAIHGIKQEQTYKLYELNELIKCLDLPKFKLTLEKLLDDFRHEICHFEGLLGRHFRVADKKSSEIQQSKLSTRAKNICSRNGVDTFHDLKLCCGTSDIYEWRGLGKGTLNEIIQYFKDNP